MQLVRMNGIFCYPPGLQTFKYLFEDCIERCLCYCYISKNSTKGRKYLMSQYPANCLKNYTNDTSSPLTFCSWKDCHPDNEHRLIKAMD